MKAKARIVATEDMPAEPARHWGIAVFLASAGSWLLLIAAAKLVIRLW